MVMQIKFVVVVSNTGALILKHFEMTDVHVQSALLHAKV